MTATQAQVSLENSKRLSDRILSALQLALEQKDLDIAEELAAALEKAMTRLAGGQSFEERRDFPEALDKALADLDALRAELKH